MQLIESEGKDIKVFLGEVQAAWDKMWESVYTADAAGERGRPGPACVCICGGASPHADLCSCPDTISSVLSALFSEQHGHSGLAITAGLCLKQLIPSQPALTLPMLEHPDIPKFDYSFSMRVMQLLVVCCAVVLFLGTIAAMTKLMILTCVAMGDLGCKTLALKVASFIRGPDAEMDTGSFKSIALVSSLAGWFLVSISGSRAPSAKIGIRVDRGGGRLSCHSFECLACTSGFLFIRCCMTWKRNAILGGQCDCSPGLLCWPRSLALIFSTDLVWVAWMGLGVGSKDAAVFA
eukprot:547406-Pelagomonas_calceolata.AAC.2